MWKLPPLSTASDLCAVVRHVSPSFQTVRCIRRPRTGTFDLAICCNGLMAGLSASTSNVGFLTPWAACITGALAGLMYVGVSRLLVRAGC